MIANQWETAQEIGVVVKKPTIRYLDQYVKLHCGPDLARAEVFPNAKEITESFAAFQAARMLGLPLRSPRVTVIAVGDGTRPRTAVTFALRSAWTAISVDPALRTHGPWHFVDRLVVRPEHIETFRLETSDPVIVVAVHSHADLKASVASVRGTGQVAVIAISCCVPLTLDVPPDLAYSDWGIWSPERTVKVWWDARKSVTCPAPPRRLTRTF